MLGLWKTIHYLEIPSAWDIFEGHYNVGGMPYI